jgi:hypothetical protein
MSQDGSEEPKQHRNRGYPFLTSENCGRVED